MLMLRMDREEVSNNSVLTEYFYSSFMYYCHFFNQAFYSFALSP